MFKSKNKSLVVIKNTLKKDWIILLVFVVISISIAGQIASLVQANNNDSDIDKMQFYELFYKPVGGGDTKHYVGVNNFLYFLLSGPIVVYLTFFFMLMFSIHFLYETANKKINIWLTTPISRTKLFISKIITIYIQMAIIYFPLFLCAFIIQFKNNEFRSSDLLNFFLQSITLITFVLAMTSFFAVIYMLLFDHLTIVNFLLFALNLFFIGMFITDKVLKMNVIDNSATKMFNYIDLYNVMGNQFDIARTNDWAVLTTNQQFLYNKVNPKHSYLAGGLCIPISLLSYTLFGYLSICQFKKIDMNI